MSDVIVSSKVLTLDEKISNGFQVVLASFFLALCAQIEIPLYFTPVPITVQTLGVFLIGAVLGSRKGSLAVMLYVVQGGLGAPFFAGGSGGLIHLLGPTGGYLMAYPLQGYLVGKFAEKKDLKLLVGFFLAICVQLGIGSLWLAQFVGIKKCLILGFYPFILGDVMKAFIVTMYLKFQRKI